MTVRGKLQVRLKGKYRKGKPLTEIKTMKFVKEKKNYVTRCAVSPAQCVFGIIIDKVAHLCYNICATLHIYIGAYSIRFIVQ